jgi:hypothetical protein
VSSSKADHAKKPKGHCKDPRALLAHTTEVDSRNRVWSLVVVVVAERTKCMARADVPLAQVPHN